jgi:hypothetical protein
MVVHTDLGPPVLTDLKDVQVDEQDGLLSEIHLTFTEGVLVLLAEPDNDELHIRFDANDPGWAEDARPESRLHQSPWAAVAGADSPWRWRLANQQGYADGFQIEFRTKQGDVTLQHVVAASSMYVAVVTPTVE